MKTAKKNGLTKSNIWTLKFIFFCELNGCPAMLIGNYLSSGSDKAKGKASLQRPAWMKLREMGLITWETEKSSNDKKPWKLDRFHHGFKLTEKGKQIVFAIRKEENAE